MPDYSNQPSNSSSKARNFLKSFTILGSFVVLTGLFVIVSILNQKNVAPQQEQAIGACSNTMVVRVSQPSTSPAWRLDEVANVGSCGVFAVQVVADGSAVLSSDYKVKIIYPDGTSEVAEGNSMLNGQASAASKLLFNTNDLTQVSSARMLNQNGTYIFRAVSKTGSGECYMARVNLTGCSGATTAPMVQDKDGWLVDSVGSCQNLTDNSGNVVTNSQGMCSKKVVQNGNTIQRINQNVKCDNSACPAKAGDGATCTNIKPYYVTGANDGHGATLGDYYCQDRQTASSYDHPQNIGYKCDGTTRCSSPVVTPPPVTSSITVCAPESNKTGCTDGYVGTTAEDAAAKLQKAITDIQAGGTINVKNGVYKNTTTIDVQFQGVTGTRKVAYLLNKNLTLTGESRNGVVLDGTSAPSDTNGVRGIVSTGNANVTVSNVTVNKYSSNGFVSYDNSTMNVTNSNTINNKAIGFGSWNNSKMVIKNSLSQGNAYISSGDQRYGGVDIEGSSTLEIYDSIIDDNGRGIQLGVGSQSVKLTIKNTQVINTGKSHMDYAVGFGIVCDSQNAVITADSTGNTFSNNKRGNYLSNGGCPGTTEASLTATSNPPTASSITVCAPESNKTGCTDGYVGTTAEDAAAKLQKAIADIPAGGTINVKNGVYKNTTTTEVQFQGVSGTVKVAYLLNKNLTLTGESRDGVVLDGTSAPSDTNGVRGIVSNGNANVIISKFKVKNFSSYGFLIADDSQIKITDVATETNGYSGFGSWDNSTGTVDSSFANTNAISGFIMYDSSSVAITNTYIIGNANGIINRSNKPQLIKNNWINNNNNNNCPGCQPRGVGVICSAGSITSDSTGNTFSNNPGGNFFSRNGGCPGTTEASLTAASTTYSVGGYVQDADTGRGYKDLTMLLISPNKENKTVKTDNDGKYLFSNALNVGDQYKVWYVAPPVGTVKAAKNAADTGDVIAWTYRTFENVATKRDTNINDVAYEFQKAGENDCAGLRNGVANTNNRCNFVVTTTSSPIPACTSLTVNDQYGSGTSPILINIGASAVFKLNFTNITNQTGVVNFYSYSNGTVGDLIKSGTATTVNGSTTYTYDQLKTILGDSNLDKVIQVNGTLNPFVDYSQNCVVWVKLAKPATPSSTMNLVIPNVANTKDNRYTLNPGGSVSFELTKTTAFTVAPALSISNNDNEYNPGNPKAVKYNNSDVVHTMSRVSDTKYVRTLKYEEVCVPDQNWNNQKVVNVQVNGIEGNTNDANAVRWLKCTYPTNLVNGSCPATKVVGNCGTDVAMTCASGTPNVATQKVSGDYKCLGSNGGTDSVSCSYVCTNRTLPACTRTCEKDADCGTGKTCQEVQDSTCNPGLNGAKQACVATPAVNCIKTGCNGEICSDHSVDTTCQYKDVYACYKAAECKVQTNGQCGFTQTDTLKSCIASYSVTKCNKYDLNSDGKVDIFNDFTIFLNNFINNNLNSDFNNDKVVDIKDFLLFKSALYKYIDTKSCNL